MNSIEQTAQIIASAEYMVAFSGAGISAESGIPTFRDPGGLWDQYDAGEIGTSGGLLKTIMKNPAKMMGFFKETVDTFDRAVPNPGHYGLVELEKMGILKSVVTQNIDDLHSMAGNTVVWELHGNVYRSRCLKCGKRAKSCKEEVIGRARKVMERPLCNLGELAALALKKCECGGLMRPDVVMFGEAVQQLPQSFAEAGKCDVMLVLGTSGVVYPAAGVPYEAKRAGAKIVEINPNDNAFADISDAYVNAPTGEAMPKIIDLVKETG